MRLEDALMVIPGQLDAGESLTEANYKWVLAACEVVIKRIYSMGYEIVEKDGIKDFLGND